MDEHLGFKIGDLVRVLDLSTMENFIFRPSGFPYGKIGLIVDISEAYKYPMDTDDDVYMYPRGGFDYDFRWYYEELIMILITGRTFWVFSEELELYNKEEDGDLT